VVVADWILALQTILMVPRALVLRLPDVKVQLKVMKQVSALLPSQLLAFCTFKKSGLRRRPPSPADVTRWLFPASGSSGQRRSPRP